MKYDFSTVLRSDIENDESPTEALRKFSLPLISSASMALELADDSMLQRASRSEGDAQHLGEHVRRAYRHDAQDAVFSAQCRGCERHRTVTADHDKPPESFGPGFVETGVKRTVSFR